MEQESVAGRKWIPSAFFFFSHCWCWFTSCRQTLRFSSTGVHFGSCGFSGRLRALRQANNRCCLPADGATCLDFHTYTSWWSKHQPEVAKLQKLCSLLTPVVCRLGGKKSSYVRGAEEVCPHVCSLQANLYWQSESVWVSKLELKEAQKASFSLNPPSNITQASILPFSRGSTSRKSSPPPPSNLAIPK